MNYQDLNQIRQQLLNLRDRLMELEESTAKSSQIVELDQSRVGRLSRMDALQAQQMSMEAGRRQKIQLQKIAGALRRIESEEYGYCAVCDEAIYLPRLMADPTNTRCLGCAEKGL